MHELAPLGTAAVDPRSPVLLYLTSLSQGSRSTQAGAIRDIARFLGGNVMSVEWHRLDVVGTMQIRAWAVKQYAPATAKRYLSALRGVLRASMRMGTMTADAYRTATDVEPVRGSNELAGRSLPAGELRALFVGMRGQQPILAARNACMLALLYGCGLRRAEVVDLDRHDIEGNRVHIRRGKGAKSRTVYLPESGLAAVRAWLAVRGEAPGPLLWPTTGGRPERATRLHEGRRMSPHSVRLALRGIAARVNVRAFSPHDLRRTWVGDMLDAGADLATVQRLAGHEDASTTARYDRRPERAKEKAAELIHVPFDAGAE